MLDWNPKFRYTFIDISDGMISSISPKTGTVAFARIPTRIELRSVWYEPDKCSLYWFTAGAAPSMTFSLAGGSNSAINHNWLALILNIYT